MSSMFVREAAGVKRYQVFFRQANRLISDMPLLLSSEFVDEFEKKVAVEPSEDEGSDAGA